MLCIPIYPLECGKLAKVDNKDFWVLAIHQWFLSPLGYAYRRDRGPSGGGDSKMVLMHRQILGTPDGMWTDHANHDTLDNRRSNIRICTPSQNAGNRHKKRSINGRPTSSQYKSVYRGWNGMWSASCAEKHLGYFTSEEAAARAYDAAAREFFGEFALTNFPAGAVA